MTENRLAPILPRVAVVQPGARHNYAIAQMLQDRGALVGLATDFAWLNSANYAFLMRALARRLPGIDRRRIPHLPRDKVNAIWGATLLNGCSRWFGEADNRLAESWFDMRCGRRWLDEANVMYSLFGAGAGYIRRARDNGLLIATEIFVTPVAHRIVAEEQRAFPGWDTRDDGRLSFDMIEARVSMVIGEADLLICPSETVVDGLRQYDGFNEEKAAIIPYGHAARAQIASTPQRGRVLFAGSAILRKGIHYLAKAASLLKARAPRIEIFVAGEVTANVRSKHECQYLNFLGQLGPREMALELSQADIFVLPTLAEGSASTINEALAAGVPVVTTLAAGSIVRNGVEGLIVPERNPDALAEAILYIESDRKVRAEMSSCAKQAIAARSQPLWGDELMEALSQLLK